ncbi:MAG: divalent metal cation transporter, partial [Calditrichaeota bacterium]
MKRAKQWFTIIGPGIAVAATGVGAGDMVAAAVSGAKFGTLVLWAAIFGAVLKFVLNEGIARWQLATGKTLLEGWSHYFGRWVSIYFLIYLLLWSFIVAGALIAACGLAAHAIFPEFSVSVWGIIHSLLAVLLILIGRYALFETLMKFFIGMMFLVMVSCALWIQPGWMDMFHHLLIPTIP